MDEPREREDRDKQSAREELACEYAALLRMAKDLKTDSVLLPLIERLRADLAQAIREL